MLSLLNEGYLIFNVDESALVTQEMRRKKWRTFGMTNSIRDRPINPRLSIIACVTSEGNVYMSLS